MQPALLQRCYSWLICIAMVISGLDIFSACRTLRRVEVHSSTKQGGGWPLNDALLVNQTLAGQGDSRVLIAEHLE